MTVDLGQGLPLVLGGNTFGWTSDEDTSFAVLDAFSAAGARHVDTADVYSAWAEGNHGGESELVLGRWMAARGNRDQVLVATKVGKHPDFPGLGRESVERALAASLERLRTDHVDLYYAHADDESLEIAQIARTFDGLVRQGTIRWIGMSNVSPERARAWVEVARAEGLAAPVAIQPQYSLAARQDFEAGDGPLARELGLHVFSYFSLASGLLSGKYRSREDLAGAAREGFLEQFATPDGFALVEALTGVAGRLDVEPASVALAWLRAKGVAAPIASASRPEQVPALVTGAQLELSAQDVAELDDASQPFA
ncbi:aldo/keto reductase [Luteococcus peritonei]|uniref:Aldo/keto reductase n=1 Tax=Luteococcus peritonei TaxID=88874 RepID=A0ABW4RSL2_9ACTN